MHRSRLSISGKLLQQTGTPTHSSSSQTLCLREGLSRVCQAMKEEDGDEDDDDERERERERARQGHARSLKQPHTLKRRSVRPEFFMSSGISRRRRRRGKGGRERD